MKSSGLPPSWSIVELDALRAQGEYTLIGGPFGSDLTQKDYVLVPGVPVIRGTNLGGDQSLFVDEGFVYVSEQKAKALRRNLAYPGDLIFTQRGTLGQVAIIPRQSKFQQYVISQSQMKLTPDPTKVDTQFLYHYFRTPHALQELLSKTQATGVPHINLGILKRFPVMLPPLMEQRRIAAILEQADALRRKRKQAISKLETLLRSVFLHTFGDPARNPRCWPELSLGDVIAGGPQNGLYKPASAYGDGSPILRIDGFYHGEVTNLDQLKRVRISDAEAETYGLHADDIVINRVNSRIYLGKSAIIPQLDEPTVFESNMMRFSVDKSRVDSHYLIRLLQTSFVKSQILSRAKDAINQSSINQQDVKALRVLLPPIDLQREFACFLEKRAKQVVLYRKSLAGLDRLFHALQQDLFRGDYEKVSQLVG